MRNTILPGVSFCLMFLEASLTVCVALTFDIPRVLQDWNLPLTDQSVNRCPSSTILFHFRCASDIVNQPRLIYLSPLEFT
ncbi:hypothetical protein EV361DRAFT_934837, partial [Lentinula raphanica]